MDLQTLVLAMAEAALASERRMKRLMEQSLREKERERASLMAKKEEMLAEEAAKQKLADDFMAFSEAIENNDPEISHNFDEKAMLNAILHMMNSYCCDGNVYGEFIGGNNAPNIKQDFKEKAKIDSTIAMSNSDGNFEGNNEGLAEGDNVLKIKPDLKEKVTMDATIAMINSDSNYGGNDGGFVQGRIDNALENAHILGEEAMNTTAAIQERNNDPVKGDDWSVN